ncbi:phenylalanine--tRNA ligase subunit beta [Lapidilactobacillus salsurivasis]
MKISYQWLNQMVDLHGIDPQKLADQVSVTGIEVASVIAPDAGLKKIVIGHILSTKPHPDSDHLTLCQVDLGAAEPVQIVCGAPNVAADQYVIVALPGSRIAGNVKIKRGKMRGEASEGMICGLQEIGFSDSVVPKEFANGIYVFPQPEPVGDPVFPYLGMDDRLIDFDITPNRADTLGMHGAAYEVGAMLHEQPRFPEVNLNATGLPTRELIKVDVENPELVPQYLMRVVQNVTIKPSPLWLQIRLWNNGIRPINNVVDVTNFVLLEYGQPLHAFDYDKIPSKQIVVRTARADEQLTTLDDEAWTLRPTDLVITDGTKPLALAGVMGGLDSEIDEQTTNVLLESAVFNGTAIRKTAQWTNLHSEASTRFEKGINQDDVGQALDRAVQLLCDLADGTASEGTVIGHQVLPAEPEVLVDPQRVNHVLGTQISAAAMRQILSDLQFKHQDQGNQILVTVPRRRWDISIEADLIEEIARLYGYDKLPSTLPTGVQTQGAYNHRQQLIRTAKRNLLAQGLDEVISYSLLTEPQATAFAAHAPAPIKLAWPMTQDHAYLRENLISGLILDLKYNLARHQNNVQIFEQGNVFIPQGTETQPLEVPMIAALWSGELSQPSWLNKPRAVDFYDAKGVVEELLTILGVQDQVVYEAETGLSDLHPGRTARLKLGEATLGFVGEVHPNVQHEHNLPATYVMQLDLSVILAASLPAVVAQPAAKYPAIDRDLALILDQQVTNAEVEAVITAQAGKYLQNVQIFDVFAGEKIGHLKRSLAYRLHFQNAAATLTDDEINQAMTKVTQALTEQLHAQVR